MSAHAPGTRLRHTKTGRLGTVLAVEWEWPTYLDQASWSYVRFDDGVHAYCPDTDLGPRAGEEYDHPAFARDD